jgi:hypothetical protein
MIYLSNGINESLRKAFNENNLLIKQKSDYVIVENSQDQTDEKIRRIISSVGFCPLISRNKINGNFVFTIVPYKTPDFFLAKQIVSQSPSDIHISQFLKITNENKTNYFSFDEISLLLEKMIFSNEQEIELPEDKWVSVNNFRSFVSTAFNNGLFELISKNVKDEHPIVEIGSEIGYSLHESLSPRIIRVQPSNEECQLLRRSISDPIYQTNIEGLYNSLLESNKKIPLFFALDVFDTMSSEARKVSFSQLSQLQNIGDRILIMLDTNPRLDVTIKDLEALYPNHVLFPYFPPTTNCTKLSLVIVPQDQVQFKLSADELANWIDGESWLIMKGLVSKMQSEVNKLQNKLNLKIIELEDFFVEQVKQELEQTGYKANVYYHASFSTGELPKGIISEVKQDLVYKSVTDTSTVRQWSLSDQNLVNWLGKKKLKLPNHFTETFLNDLRKNYQKIFGAEFLVIEATKLN